MAKRTWKSRFKPGDVVMFNGPWKFQGAQQQDGVFRRDVEYTVMDVEIVSDQLDAFARPHTLLSPEHPTGSPDGHGRWVDETCIELTYTEPTEKEIAELFGLPMPEQM